MHRVLAAIVLVHFCAGAAAAQSPLGEADIRAALFGNTLTSNGPPSGTWDTYVATNGDAIIKGAALNGFVLADKGRATIEGGKFCIAWQSLRGGQKTCQQVVRQGDRYMNRSDDGSIASVYLVRPGNAANLN